MKDNNGTKIEVGSRVVFNRSGELEFGEVTGFKDKTSMQISWSDKAKGIKPQSILVKAERYDNISVVRYPTNVMVIE